MGTICGSAKTYVDSGWNLLQILVRCEAFRRSEEGSNHQRIRRAQVWLICLPFEGTRRWECREIRLAGFFFIY